MKEVLIGAFSTHEDADNAIDELGDKGYEAKDISVIMQQSREEIERMEKEAESDTPGKRFTRGLGRGTVEGGVIGGLAGILVGALGIVVVGPIAVLMGLTGIIGTIVTGVIVGAAAGGIVASLVNLGVPRETAVSYEACVKAGGVILAVPTDHNKEEIAREIFESNGVQDLVKIEVEEKEAMNVRM